MYRYRRALPALFLLLTCCFHGVSATAQISDPQIEAFEPLSPLVPPPADGPVRVRTSFVFQEVTEIDDLAETIQFGGILRLVWKDERQAFDPDRAGLQELVFQGNYQFNELSPAWYPEVVLANVSGLYEQQGVVLRIKPDGTSILTSVINGIAEVDLDMRRYPFDRQNLQLVFEPVGFMAEEVALVVDTDTVSEAWKNIKLSQWQVNGIKSFSGDEQAADYDKSGEPSIMVVALEVERKSMFVVRLVMVPLLLIVVLSWTVFWMERSSLGDRISVSFIGILTAVAYQNVVSDLIPHLSYHTFINTFILVSFCFMFATVLVNLLVGASDKKGQSKRGDLIDIRCRWIFPASYLGCISLVALAYFSQ